MMSKLLGFLVLCAPIVAFALKLESYNVDPESVTISGLSSGGAMVMQFHVAFSKHVHGAGIFAGLPFGCAKGGLTAATLCMTSPSTVNVNNLIKEIDTLASGGKIDSTSNLNRDPVFIFHGTKDTTVFPASGKKIEEIYAHYGGDIQTEYDIASVHGFPTDFYGAACGSSSATTHYINNCNYHGAFIMLQHLYQREKLNPPTSTLAGELIEFEQKEFISAMSVGAVSMDSHGYVYVPSGCKDRSNKCKFHIAFHGCSQSKTTLKDIYATKTGFLEVAEANDVIVLFPQAAPAILVGNPNGCWDWWGYLNSNFLNQAGGQMEAVYNMLNRVVNCDGAPNCYDDVTNAPTDEPPNPQTTTPPSDGDVCEDNKISFRPFPGSCEYYTLCACGAQVLLQCAPGLYFDPKIDSCNFIQLVDCTP